MATKLAAYLRSLIAAQGPITVARFMAEALGHPEHGYYRTRDPLGAAGDFTTAPEISQAFGELIGAWTAVVWDQAGRPDPVGLVELGPGRGTLMADLLRTIGKVAPAFRAAAEIHLVETSPALRAAQAATLDGQPTWHDDVASLPDGPAIVIANEFLDALPVHQLVARDGRWHERLVGVDPETDRLRFEIASGPSPLSPAVPSSVAPADGVIFEWRPAAISLVADVGERLRAHGGAALFVDYGHGESAAGDTLQAVRDHAFAPVLEAPGEADLTAHVDFGALRRAAEEAGIAAHGPVTQGSFLRTLGIETRRAALTAASASPAEHAAIEAGIRRLIDPDQMGTLFEVLALTPRQQAAPPGFVGRSRAEPEDEMSR